MMDVRYADEVRDDLLSSMAWLDARRAGLGEELEDEFFAAVLDYRVETDVIVVMGLFVGGRDESRLRHRGEPADDDNPTDLN